jgi:hypothetical protein
VESESGRSWTSIGDRHQARTGYWAEIAKLDSERAAGIMFTIISWLVGSFAVFGFDPRYRVLVGRAGSDEYVGVRQARNERQARKQLVEVAQLLDNSSEDEVRTVFDITL